MGYLEAHIEQGDYLEATGKHIGIVSEMTDVRNRELAELLDRFLIAREVPAARREALLAEAERIFNPE